MRPRARAIREPHRVRAGLEEHLLPTLDRTPQHRPERRSRPPKLRVLLRAITKQRAPPNIITLRITRPMKHRAPVSRPDLAEDRVDLQRKEPIRAPRVLPR